MNVGKVYGEWVGLNNFWAVTGNSLPRLFSNTKEGWENGVKPNVVLSDSRYTYRP